MRLLILFFALCLVAACQSEPPAQELQSPKGHAVLFQPMPKAKSVAVLAHWPNRWSETPGVNLAVPYVGSQLMTLGGAGEFDALTLQQKYTELGVQGSLTPHLTGVIGSLQLRSGDLQQSAKLLNISLRNPSFDPRWAERIANDIAEKQQEANQKSMVVAGQTLITLALEDELARQSVFVEDLQLLGAVQDRELRSWHKQIFDQAPQNIVVSGDLDADAALSLVDNLFAGLPAAAANGKVLISNADLRLSLAPQNIVLAAAEGANSVVVMAAEIAAAQDADLEALVASVVLGGGEHGRMFKAVREQVGGSYHFNFGLGNFSQSTRYLELSGEVSAQKLSAVRQAAMQAYDSFWRDGPTAEEIEAVRERIEQASEQVFKSNPLGTAVSLREHRRLGWGASGRAKVKAAFEALSADSVKAYVQANWPKSDRFVTIAVSSDPEVLGEACVINKPSEVLDC